MNDDDMKKELFHQLMQAVKLSVEELRQDEISPLSKRKYEDQLQQLMCLITTICDLHREEFVAEFSFDMTNSLNSLIESEYIGGITKTSVQKMVLNMKSPTPSDNFPEEHVAQRVDKGSTPKGDFPLRVEQPLHPLNHDYACQNKPGSILFSKLALEGWRFPPYLFTEADEKILFDVEVKLKMGHHSAGRLVFDALMDYPANAILQRVGLLESMMNLLTAVDTHETDCISYKLNAKVVLQWFHVLISKCGTLLSTYLNGSMCSPYVCEARDFEESSLAMKMTHEIRAMRDPLHVDCRCKESYISLAAGLESTPSFPGIAFSVVAISLPLLARKDMELTSDVVRLIEAALPYTYECLVNEADDVEIEFIRLQHFLDRMEQLFQVMELPSTLLQQSYQHPDSDESKLWAVNITFDLSLCSVLVRLLSFIVEDASLCLSSGSTHENAYQTNDFTPTLSLGPSVLNVIRLMYSTFHLGSLFPRDLLHSILKCVDPAFLEKIAKRNLVCTACKRILHHCMWGDVGPANLRKVYGFLSELYTSFVEYGDKISSPLYCDIISGHATVQAVNIFAAMLPIVLVVSGEAMVSSPEVQLEGELLSMICDILHTSAERKDLKASVVLSIEIFLGLKEAVSNDEAEIVSVQGHILSRLQNYATSQRKELEQALLRRISNVSFLYRYLENVALPSLSSGSFAKNSPFPILLPCLVEECQLDFDDFSENCEKSEMLGFIVYHFILLTWKLCDSRGDFECKTRSALEKFVNSLQARHEMINTDAKYSTCRRVLEQSIFKAYCTGLYNSRERIRKSCFHELCSAESVAADLKAFGCIDMKYCEYELLGDDMYTPSTSQTIYLHKIIASNHSGLQGLLDMAFGDVGDPIIRYSALKQLNVLCVKDPDLFLTLDYAVCFKCVANLNEIISRNYLDFFSSTKVRSSDTTEQLVIQCVLLLRSLLATVPAFLNEIIVVWSLHTSTSDKILIESQDCVVATYVLHVVLLSRSENWGREMATNSLRTFSVCCHDILRLWVFRPRYFKKLKSEERVPLIAGDYSLPAHCCYSSELTKINYSVVPIDIKEKYMRPLSYSFSDTLNLIPKAIWRHVDRVDIDDGDRQDELGYSNEDSCHLIRDYVRVLSTELCNSNRNSLFNESLQLCYNALSSFPFMLSSQLMKSTVLSGAVRIIQNLPNTLHDYLTLNSTMKFLRLYLSSWKNHVHEASWTAGLPSLWQVVTDIVLCFHGILRHFLKGSSRDITSSVVDESRQNALLLLSDAFLTLSDVRSYGRNATDSNSASDVSIYISLIVESFVDALTHSNPALQYAACLCMKSLSGYAVASNSAPFSVDALTCPSSQKQTSLFDMLIKNIKCLRNPNSMKGSCQISGTLRCLIMLLKLDNTDTLLKRCWLVLDCECLVRLSRDRRSIVRLSSLELINSIYFSKSYFLHIGIEKLTSDTIVSLEGSVVGVLRNISGDDFEAASIRCLSMRILLEAVKAGEVDHEHLHDVRFILTIVSQLLAELHCFEVYSACLQFIREILEWSSCKEQLRDTLELITTLKIVPRLVSILQPNFLTTMVNSAASRTYEGGASSGMDNRSCGGWQKSKLTYFYNQHSRNDFTKTLCLMNLIKIFDFEGGIILQCVRNSNIIRNLVFTLTDISYTKLFVNCDTVKKGENIESTVNALLSCADLFSLLLIRDQTEKFQSGKINEQYCCVRHLVKDHVVISASIASSMTKYFRYVAAKNELRASSSFDKFVLSMLRLLMLLLNDSTWRLGFGLEASELNDSASGLAEKYIPIGMGLLQSLVSLQESNISSSNAYLIDAVTALENNRRGVKNMCIKMNEEKSDSSKLSSVVLHAMHGVLNDSSCKENATNTEASTVVPDRAISTVSATTRKKSALSRHRRLSNTRGFKVMQRPTNGSACPFSSQAEFWSILLFVASVFKHSEKCDVRAELISFGVPTALMGLFESYMHMSYSCNNSNSKLNVIASSSPAQAVLLCVMSIFISGSSATKNACLLSPTMRMSKQITMAPTFENDENDRSLLLCELLQLGLQPSVELHVRLLSLRLLEEFARDYLHGAATLRTTIYSRIVTALQADLNKTSRSATCSLPAPIFAILLDALGSILLSSTICNRHCNGAKLNKEASAPPSHELSAVELIKWTYERHQLCPEVLFSLLRFIGRVCNEAHVLSRPKPKRQPTKKNFAVVSSEEVVGVLSECFSQCHDSHVREMASTVLWFILHKSGSALSFFKKNFLNSYQAKLKLLDRENTACHAEMMVYLLISNSVSCLKV